MASKIKNQRAPMTVDGFRKKYGIKITTEMSGKMEGMWSISTSCNANPFCIARMRRGDAVCVKCYAHELMNVRKVVDACYRRNYDALNSQLIPVEDWPLLNVALFRIEAFGDVGSVTHARNYLRLIKRNPHVSFAWWTKNPNLIEQAMKLEGFRPVNCQFVLSSLNVNVLGDFSRWSWAQKDFTVFDKAHAEDINCGALHCLSCQKCYHDNGIRHMRELLK